MIYVHGLNRGTGSNVREFVLSYIDSAEFARTGWTKAQNQRGLPSRQQLYHSRGK